MSSIILVNKELKIGGFKPLDPTRVDWKSKIAKVYGPFRLDAFMLGLLWLEFSGFDLSFIHQDIDDQVLIKEILAYQNMLKNSIIVNKLLDLKGYPDYELDQILLDFQEFFIL